MGVTVVRIEQAVLAFDMWKARERVAELREQLAEAEKQEQELRYQCKHHANFVYRKHGPNEWAFTCSACHVSNILAFRDKPDLCAHCGTYPQLIWRIYVEDVPHWHVVCGNIKCPHTRPTALYGDIHKAITAWNERQKSIKSIEEGLDGEKGRGSNSGS